MAISSHIHCPLTTCRCRRCRINVGDLSVRIITNGILFGQEKRIKKYLIFWVCLDFPGIIQNKQGLSFWVSVYYNNGKFVPMLYIFCDISHYSWKVVLIAAILVCPFSRHFFVFFCLLRWIFDCSL